MKHTFYLDNLQITGKSVSLQCVFHSIRFKVNKGWSKALLLFLMFVPHFPLNNIDLIKNQVTMNIDFITLTKDNMKKNISAALSRIRNVRKVIT